MSSYRSFLWSRKDGLVQRVSRPAAEEGEALLAQIHRMGQIALRLRGLRSSSEAKRLSAAQKLRNKAQLHLLRAERLIRQLGETDAAATTALLRARLK